MNTFQQYFYSLTSLEKQGLAKRATTSVAYLYQVASGHRNAGWKTVQNLVGADSNISFSMFQFSSQGVA